MDDHTRHGDTETWSNAHPSKLWEISEWKGDGLIASEREEKKTLSNRHIKCHYSEFEFEFEYYGTLPLR